MNENKNGQVRIDNPVFEVEQTQLKDYEEDDDHEQADCE